jgi:hypothetical protein
MSMNWNPDSFVLGPLSGWLLVAVLIVIEAGGFAMGYWVGWRAGMLEAKRIIELNEGRQQEERRL